MGQTQTVYAYNGHVTGSFPDGFDPMNRGFLLGDGFFESIRVIGGKPVFWQAHHARVEAACRALDMDIPPHLEKDFLYNAAVDLLEHGDISSGGRLRLTVFREGRGTYFHEGRRAFHLMEASKLFPGSYTVSDRGLAVGVYDGGFRQPHEFSRFKMLGNHLSIRAAGWAIDNHYDEALVLNENGFIAESTSGNLFAVIGGEVHTPPLSDGCVGGVMRMAVINAALSEGIPIFETQLAEADVLAAEEVFLTNAIRGITWVRSLRDKRYFHKLSDRILDVVRRMSLESLV